LWIEVTTIVGATRVVVVRYAPFGPSEQQLSGLLVQECGAGETMTNGVDGDAKLG
jgi:hypothetical protein